MLPGKNDDTGPSITSLIALLLCLPRPKRIICFASIIVPIPTVIASDGCVSFSLKKRELFSRVFCVNVLTLVLELKLDVGSLNPICPLVPIPRT